MFWFLSAFGGEKWKTNVLLTALLCPGWVHFLSSHPGWEVFIYSYTFYWSVLMAVSSQTAISCRFIWADICRLKEAMTVQHFFFFYVCKWSVIKLTNETYLWVELWSGYFGLYCVFSKMPFVIKASLILKVLENNYNKVWDYGKGSWLKK